MLQGLLKVAVDNARVQEKQIQQEKKELKMELCRERELRESLERQLTAELQSRGKSEEGKLDRQTGSYTDAPCMTLLATSSKLTNNFP